MTRYNFSQVDSVEKIYQIIGQLIADTIPEDWLEAILSVELEDDNGSLSGAYQPLNGERRIYFDPPTPLYFAFKELRRRFHKPGHAPSVKARFMLYPDGHFDLDFTYPDETTR